MRSLVIAELGERALNNATHSMVTAALACSADVDVLVAGCGIAEMAQQAARIAGISKVLAADGDAMRDQMPEDIAATVLAIASAYSHILFAATTGGKSIAPRVAAALDAAQISEIIRVTAPDTFERPIYAGNAVATVQSVDAVKVITVRTTAFARAEAGPPVAVEQITATGAQVRGVLVRRESAATDRADLSAASVVVSGGRALGSSEKFMALLSPLADKFGAALGASRAAVDAGYAPNNWQVGQTGKIVAPQLYIACGISGAIQHLAGMKDSKVIVAINNDPDAPIFQVADYGLVGDIFQQVPMLVEQLG